MTKDATGDALKRLADDEVRSAVAQGETDAIDDVDLTEEERAMVVAAADDFPEVEGFSSFLKIGDISGFSTQYPKVELPNSFNKAVLYSGVKVKY